MSKRWVLAVWLLATIGTLTIALAYVIQPRVSRHPDNFIGGKRPFLTGAFRQIGCFSRGIVEYRVFSWRGDYTTTIWAARDELMAAGYTGSFTDNGISWSNPNGSKVSIERGYSWTREHAMEGKKREPGVTVIFTNSLPEDFASKFRVWLEPS